jgi:2-amino-4-hydroxy-6-hydroxymethyldihydropteridine diphosphokinase
MIRFHKIYILLGSNMQEPAQQLVRAEKMITASVGRIIKSSSLYKTAAWGIRDQPDFINQVIEVETGHPAGECMDILLNIEAEMGRVRTVKNAPRVIDLDILYYDNAEIHTERLIIPHPAIAQRRFVLVPLNEIAPDFIHPVYKISNAQLLAQCNDTLDVKKF